jgi:uncharacterized damage-inducible protein DinB
MTTDPLVDTWQINARINLYLLEALPAAGLAAKAASGGRTVAEALAHVHNVRLMWLKAAAPALLDGLSKLEKDEGLTAAALKSALAQSAKAVQQLIEASLAAGGKIKGFKPHVHAFVGYLISHESHHRGQVALALKESGMPLDKKTAYGLWEWGSR